MSRAFTIVLALFALAGCTPSNSQDQVEALTPEQQAGAAVDEARTLYERSVALGHSWRATRQSLDAAESALTAGDLATAQAEAERATAIARASITQAETEAANWQNRIPFNQP